MTKSLSQRAPKEKPDCYFLKISRIDAQLQLTEITRVQCSPLRTPAIHFEEHGFKLARRKVEVVSSDGKPLTEQEKAAASRKPNKRESVSKKGHSYDVLRKKLEKVEDMLDSMIDTMGEDAAYDSKKFQQLEKKRNEYLR